MTLHLSRIAENNMKKNNNEKIEVKIPKLSPESVTLALIVISFIQENSLMIMPMLQKFLKLQDPKDSVKEFEGAIKKQIYPAVQMTCVLPLVEKFILEEHSARATVAFIYIVARLLYQQMGIEMKPVDFTDLWKKIWQHGRMFPTIDREWKRAEDLNDLRGWQEEMQENAKEKWKYFINKQQPLAKERINQLNEKMQALFTLSPTEEI